MGGLQDAVLAGVDRFGLVLGRFPPKQKHHILALSIDRLNDGICELLPAALRMRVRLAVLHCQGSIEHEYSLFCPLGEISMGRSLLDEFVADKVFVDVFKGRGRRHWFEDTEAESMSLVRLVIGVLANNDHFYVGDRGLSEGIEDIFHLGVNLNSIPITFFPDSYSSLTYL